MATEVCGNIEPNSGAACDRRTSNHPRCSGFDEAIDDYRDWENPSYLPPKNTDSRSARETVKAAAAATAPDTRVESGPAAGEAASARSAGTWSDAERALVVEAVRTVCERHASADDDEFTVDEVWDELAGAVPVTKGLTAIMRKAQRDGLCDTTGKRTRSTRGGAHDHGQNLEVWYSLVKRIR